MRNFLIFLTLVFLTGCINYTPKKDLFFRMRPPTSEIPFFQSDKSFGMKVQMETKRFTANPTQNLVTNFDFNNNSLYTSEDSAVSGVDIAGLYTRSIFGVPTEFSLSFDFGKIKFQVLDARTDDRGIYITANYGYYKTAAYSDISSCGSLLGIGCDSTSLEKARSIENGIHVDQSGREQKMGLSVAFYFDQRRGVFLSYNRFDAKIRMHADRLSGSPLLIESEENVGAVSTGLGYFYRWPSSSSLVAVTLDSVTMRWRTEELSRGVGGLHYSFEF